MASRDSDWTGDGWGGAVVAAPVVSRRTLSLGQGQTRSAVVQPVPADIVLPFGGACRVSRHDHGCLPLHSIAECAGRSHDPDRVEPGDRALALCLRAVPRHRPVHSWGCGLSLPVAAGSAPLLAGDWIVRHRARNSLEPGKDTDEPAIFVFHLFAGGDGLYCQQAARVG